MNTEKEHSPGEHPTVGKKGRVCSSFLLNVISTDLHILQINMVSKHLN